MKLQEQCTTKEQSKRLLELGFEKDTASLNWWLVSQIESNNEDYISSNTVGLDIIPHIPCWTVADMMTIIHDDVKEIYWEECDDYDDAVLIISNNFAVQLSDVATGEHNIEFYNHKPLLRDNLFECLVWLKENKYL